MVESDLQANFYEKISVLNKTIWENKISEVKIKNWLTNFLEEEKTMALYLLSEFMYFGDAQMRVLLKTLYRDYFRCDIIHTIRRNNRDTFDVEIIEKQFENELKNTRFIGVGNPSESGAHLLYFFRQENNLSKKNFINSYEISKVENKDVKRVVFLDDFCGSGSQATDKDYIKYIESIKVTHPHIIIDYLMLVGTDAGINVVRNAKIFNNVDAVIKLDESFKCFEKDSRYFINSNIPQNINIVREFAKKHGMILMKDFYKKNGCPDHLLEAYSEHNSLGFNNCQLLLGFNHNTPDNTLPIIWYSETKRWTPIFKRYNKKYNF